MNPEGNIYRAPEDEIPAEDKARLEGYLIARAEMDEQRAERRTRRGGPCVRMLPSPKPPPAEAHVVRVNGRMVVAFRDPNAAWALAFTYALDGESVAVERIAEP